MVDYAETSGEFELNYHLYSLDIRHKMVVKARVSEDAAVVPTVTGVWTGADWYERESADPVRGEVRGPSEPGSATVVRGLRGLSGSEELPVP